MRRPIAVALIAGLALIASPSRARECDTQGGLAQALCEAENEMAVASRAGRRGRAIYREAARKLLHRAQDHGGLDACREGGDCELALDAFERAASGFRAGGEVAKAIQVLLAFRDVAGEAHAGRRAEADFTVPRLYRELGYLEKQVEKAREAAARHPADMRAVESVLESASLASTLGDRLAVAAAATVGRDLVAPAHPKARDDLLAGIAMAEVDAGIVEAVPRLEAALSRKLGPERHLSALASLARAHARSGDRDAEASTDAKIAAALKGLPPQVTLGPRARDEVAERLLRHGGRAAERVAVAPSTPHPTWSASRKREMAPVIAIFAAARELAASPAFAIAALEAEARAWHDLTSVAADAVDLRQAARRADEACVALAVDRGLSTVESMRCERRVEGNRAPVAPWYLPPLRNVDYAYALPLILVDPISPRRWATGFPRRTTP
jgi:hypothetical protein